MRSDQCSASRRGACTGSLRSARRCCAQSPCQYGKSRQHGCFRGSFHFFTRLHHRRRRRLRLSGCSAVPFTQMRSRTANLVCCRYFIFKPGGPVTSAVLMRPGEGRVWPSSRRRRVCHHTDRQLASGPAISGHLAYYRRSRGRSLSFPMSCTMSIFVRPAISLQISAFLQESAGELIRRNMHPLLSLTPAPRTSLNWPLLADGADRVRPRTAHGAG